MSRPDTNSFRDIFLQGTPLLDTRAPVEFAAGAFPTATNLPLLTDVEREKVGIQYKVRGQASAIELGHELVCGEVKEQRLVDWCEFVRCNPHGYLYCFRGGLRSQTAQRWLREAGVEYPLVTGGYKAMRRYLIDELDARVADAPLVLIGGATGSGKTRVIVELADTIDLEGIAGHRGSAFGHMVVPQPSQINFENALAIALLQLLDRQPSNVYLEDEGKLIGRVALPNSLLGKMGSTPMLVIDEPLESRVDVVVEDYVVDLGKRFVAAFGDRGRVQHIEKLASDIGRISKRLGGERAQRILKALEQACALQDKTGDLSSHRDWIEILLDEYYDQMYRYQMEKRQGQTLYRGTRAEVLEYASSTERRST
jgi:tRNA 2-selenouridine synthase